MMPGRAVRVGHVVLVNLLVLFVLLGLLEGGFRIIAAFSPEIPQATETRSDGSRVLSQVDSVLGYRPVNEGGRYRALKVSGQDTIYDATYTVLPGGWRHVPQKASPSGTTFVAFFGCSFTFGEGVPDSVTLPATFAAVTHGRATVYNRGFKGWGPQSMLALMESPPELVGLDQRTGIAVLTSIDHHIDRVRGSFDIVSVWGGNMPRYELDAHHLPVRQGSFAASRPIRQFVYWAAAQSLVLTRAFSRLRGEPTRSDWALMAGIVTQSCDLFAQRYDSRGCYFVLWPTSGRMARELVPLLRQKGVRILDYSTLWTQEEGRARYQIEGDGHPNAAAYRAVAAQLARDIR